jgi:kynurenine formamidase
MVKEATVAKRKTIDLSHPLENVGADGIQCVDHIQSVESYAKQRSLTGTDLSDGLYCAVEIPIPYGFKIAVFPIKIKGAGGGWVRAVAILE